VFTLQAIFPFCLPNTEAVPREKEKKNVCRISHCNSKGPSEFFFFFWFSREFMWFIGIWELGLLRFVDMGIKVWIFLWMNQVDLLDFIDFSGVECLNQSTSHSLSNAIKQVIVVYPFKQNLNPNSCCYHWFFYDFIKYFAMVELAFYVFRVLVLHARNYGLCS